jgi:hypothetical protein
MFSINFFSETQTEFVNKYLPPLKEKTYGVLITQGPNDTIRISGETETISAIKAAIETNHGNSIKTQDLNAAEAQIITSAFTISQQEHATNLPSAAALIQTINAAITKATNNDQQPSKALAR